MRVAYFERRPYLWAFSVLIVGLALSSGFGFWSPGLICHPGSILRLPLLSGWWNLPLIFSREFVAFTEGFFRPLGYALLSVARSFVGPDACGFWHVWLVGFHVVNALLVFSLMRTFSFRTGVALLSGLIFGLHPLASVVFGQVVYFPYLLGLTFLLASVRLYVAYERSGKRGFYGVSVFLFLLSMLTCKAGAGLPLFLLGYEALYRRRGFRGALIRSLPFGMALVALAPFWLYWHPNPLLYKGMEFPEGAGWNSFFSVVGASGMYLKGLLWGGGVPLVLFEVVERIFSVWHWKFLMWGGIDLILVGAAIWAVRKGYWAGLGVLWVFCGMIPFASTAWNGVEAYVSWEVLYVPLVGVAWVLGGLAEGCWKVGRRRIRIGVLVAGCVLVGIYGWRQGVLNKASESEVSYWRHVYALAPNERASVALGKAYLEEGDEEEALEFLFSPYVKQLKVPCGAMSRYYSERGDLAAAAVHLNMSVGEDVGLQFQGYEMARAIWCYKAGALDYAEAALGKITTANPLNAKAVILLSRVWMIKNYIRAARRSLSEALRIAPSDPELLRAVEQLEERARKNTAFAVPPPDPSMLRYALQRIREGAVPGEIVRASVRHPKDPVLQMEAGICLIQEGKVDSALTKLDYVTQRLSSCGYAWVTRAWVVLKAGNYEKAEVYGKRALDLDPELSAAHTVLGMISAERDDPDQAIARYRQSIRINPDHVVAYNNLGNIMARQGELDEAIKLYRQAIKVKKQFPEAHNNLGIALARQGKNREAISHFIMALHIKSDYAEAYNNLGLALAQLGETGEALASFRKALGIDPHYGKAFNNLVTILMKDKRFGEAVSVLRKRLSENPDDLDVALALARLLAVSPDARSRNGREAVRLAEQVCRAREYRGPRALGVLAAAYAEAGQYDEAVRYALDALRLATESGMDELVKQTEAQLRLFRSHRPYRM